MQTFFSVVIPTLNEEKFLPKLLSDLVKQKEKNFEVVIADGYSTDNTKNSAFPFKKNLKLYFYETRLKNVAAQRNFGALKSSGGYLIFLDADIRIGPTFLKKVRKAVEKSKGLLFLPYFSPERQDRQYKPLFDLINVLVEFSQNLSKRFSLGGSMIVEKNFFKVIGGFDEKLFIAEDHEFVQRAAQWGVKSKFIKEPKVSFSLRRMKKEGQIKFFYKNAVSTARRLFTNEEIKNKIFEYQMGGQLYNQKENQKEEFFTNYFERLKDLFQKILTS